MKKFTAVVLILVFLCTFTGCVYKDNNENSGSKTETTSQTAADNDIETLRKKYPEYFFNGSFKGIEVYVWQMSENDYRCGALAGTNRLKTKEEIMQLSKRSVSAEDMKKILSVYPGEKSDIFIIPCTQPVSSYAYVIDDNCIKKLKKLFKGYEVAVTAEETFTQNEK